MWHRSTKFRNICPPISQIWIVFTHLKLWIASAIHNFKWVKISIKQFGGSRLNDTLLIETSVTITCFYLMMSSILLSRWHPSPDHQHPQLYRTKYGQTSIKWNEWGFRPPLCHENFLRMVKLIKMPSTHRSKFEHWRSEAEHATSRAWRFPTILNLQEWAV